ncbi:uncharacterized protein LOC122372537 isoform X1 [Amphibalanus amphitrite]|uniref:uncharacterized protein LOC122372537 isoform X1 n=1 Tax=Amphibalanus amphitrite TaxID=1232801 RepID=UPI001C90A89E|nr:uncharacterized protein LOC122372537 isoform X1 [Amphibalanus amphitrite]
MRPTMTCGGGGRLVPLMVLLVHLMFVAPPAQCSWQQVTKKVCTYRPTSSRPTSLECDLRRRDWLVVDADDTLSSVSQLRIANAEHVHIRDNALASLEALDTLFLENLGNLTIEQNSVSHQLQRRKITIEMNHIDDLHLKTGSFSHWMANDLNITIKNVSSCTIHNGAIVSRSSASNATLENIANGMFYPGTFMTNLGTLSLRNVTMQLPCQYNTFSGVFGKLSLTSVGFAAGIQEGCFAAKKWDTLEIRSSQLGDVKERAIQGSIGVVDIQDTQIGSIGPRGFDLNVTRFTIDVSSLGKLAESALAIRSEHRVSILRSNITTVAQNAFDGLSSNKGTIKLSNLVIKNAVNGSLKFSDLRNLKMKKIRINIACECKIKVQVPQLLCGSKCPLSSTTRAQRRMTMRNVLCTHEGTHLPLLDHHCEHCRPRLARLCKARCRNSEDDTSASADAGGTSWIPSLAIPLGLLLLGAAVFVLCLRFRRRSAPRRRTHRVKRPQSQRVTVNDIQHPLPDLTQGARPSNGPGESQGDGEPGVGTACVRGHSLYANIAQVPDDSSVYEDVFSLKCGASSTLHKTLSGGQDSEKTGPELCRDTHEQSLYAQVTDAVMEDNHAEEFSMNSSAENNSSDPPVYAQVDKGRKSTTKQVDEPDDQKQDKEATDSTVAPTISISLDAGAKEVIPVYAQVQKADGKKPSTQSTTDRPDTAETEPGTMMSEPAVYAQIIKKKPSKKRNKSEEHNTRKAKSAPKDPVFANLQQRHDLEEKALRDKSHDKSCQPLHEPTYEDMSFLAAPGDPSQEDSSKIGDLSRHHYGNPVEVRLSPDGMSPTSSHPEKDLANPLYAGSGNSSVGMTDAGGRTPLSDHMEDNPLYGTGVR